MINKVDFIVYINEKDINYIMHSPTTETQVKNVLFQLHTARAYLIAIHALIKSASFFAHITLRKYSVRVKTTIDLFKDFLCMFVNLEPFYS